MTKLNIKELISQSTYSTIYMPIYEKNTQKIFAYEALSKFALNGEEISCTEFFSRLYTNEKLFFHLEKKNKHHQINNADKSHRLILYFDSVVFSEKEYRKFWKEYLSEYKHRIVICVLYQNASIGDSFKIKEKMIKWLVKNEFEFIINLFSDISNIFSFDDIEKATYIKIDKKILKKIEDNNSYEKLLSSVINFAKENNTKSIMKHIDSKDELMFAEKLSLDYLHGNIF